MSMTWTRLPPIEGTYGGCLNCGPRPSVFPLQAIIAVETVERTLPEEVAGLLACDLAGFGDAHVIKDGEIVWSEMEGLRAHPSPTLAELDDLPSFTGQDAEVLASQDPDHDWRIVLHGPLSGRVYQRQGVGHWVLVEQNRGFEE